ncbi:hypothetical protein ILYODFUR_029027 [Ilyodon furcidens]|uniref:Guanylate kinase-like domain-containing protein n=1 Tax=Ilyodon furcidens TaxID=33524 RepID=A0ABV0TQJ2_9TELE
MYNVADVTTHEEPSSFPAQSFGSNIPLCETFFLMPEDVCSLRFLSGPTGVGLNELKRKLLISDPQHFGVTIPHTSRPKRNQESDGVEYHFISKHLFETDVHNNKYADL